jgi:tripartite-type tricarboxylate transporter receptor subunit TctC
MKNLLTLFLLLTIIGNSFAKDVIKIYVNQAAGGTTDAFARKFQKIALEAHDTSVIVINKPGADGILAARECLNDKSGYGILMTGPGLPMKAAENESNLALYKSLTPIATLLEFPLFFMVDKKSSLNTWEDFLAQLKQRPVTIGVSSNFQRIIVEDMFKDNSNVTVVPFTGDAQLSLAVLNGTVVDVANLTSVTAETHISGGTMKGLAATYKNNLSVPVLKNLKINLITSGFLVNPSTTTAQKEEITTLISKILSNPEMIEFYKRNNFLLPADTTGLTLERYMTTIYQHMLKK